MQGKSNSLTWGAPQKQSEVNMDAALRALSNQEAKMQAPADDLDPSRQELAGVTHIEIVRAIERLHRRSLDLLRADLIQAGVDDLSHLK